MSTPGPETQILCSRLYAMSGQWPTFLTDILKGDAIPQDLVEAAERLRKVWLRVETEIELLDEMEPPKKITVSWINDSGEEISVIGFEPFEERP
jgi:hypothetical protein